jgi:hypothetical protein
VDKTNEKNIMLLLLVILLISPMGVLASLTDDVFYLQTDKI